MLLRVRKLFQRTLPRSAGHLAGRHGDYRGALEPRVAFFLCPKYQTMPRKFVPRRKVPAWKRKSMAVKTKAKRRAGGAMRYRSSLPRRYISNAGAITNSLWKLSRGRASKQALALRRVGAPDIYQSNYTSPVVCGQGIQKLISFGSLLQPQLKSILDHAPTSAPNRVLIESAQTEITFTNSTNASVEVELYDITFRRDVPLTYQFESGGYSYSGVSSPENFASSGAQAGAGLDPSASPPVLPITYIGASPYDSQIFKSYCKVNRRTHVMLASGATHRHQTMANINRVCNRTTGGMDELTYVREFSYATMLVIRGVAVYQTEEADTTTNQSFLNVVSALRIKYTYVADATNNLWYANDLPAPATAYVRNVGSGQYEAINP